MANRWNEADVEMVIERLDAINNQVKARRKAVNYFLEELMEKMRGSDCSLLKRSHYLYSGSSYEGSPIRDKADFDILLMLPKPFKADNFELIERHEPGSCKVRRIPGIEDEFRGWFNSNGFLKVQELKNYIFDKLSEILYNMNPHWDLNRRVCSMKVTIKDDGGNTLRMDIIPALSGRDLDNIPDMRPDDELPPPLLEKGHFDYYITLAAAPKLKDETDYHLLSTIAFAEMEKTCMRSSHSVLNAVRLVKLTSNAKRWNRNFGLLSFHIKRVAIKYYADLDELSNWDAYKCLLVHLTNECMSGRIDGFFIYDQNIYIKPEETAITLARRIEEVERTIQLHNLRSFFRE